MPPNGETKTNSPNMEKTNKWETAVVEENSFTFGALFLLHFVLYGIGCRFLFHCSHCHHVVGLRTDAVSGSASSVPCSLGQGKRVDFDKECPCCIYDVPDPPEPPNPQNT
eukprot:2212297-Amphidinium_carterae.1